TCVCQEETLFGSKTIQHRQRIGSRSFLECLIRNLQTTVVGNILTQCHASVGIYARSNLDAIEEVHHHLSTLVQVLGIFSSPPVFQVTVLVVLATLVVESVSHLMTDYHTDGTIVEGIIRIHIEERILQDTGGETDFVRSRVIVSVDGLRSHQPFVL